MSRHSKKNGIPDRWLDYKAVGKRLDGTRFIAFKVPLKHSLNRQLPCSDVFGPWELLDALKEENQELGLIIDLTFTKRYYQPQDVPDSLMCVKIFTAGHEIPSDGTILSFKRAVRRFLQDNADNDKLIGVHCTHGLNRTGYLICRYLIDVDGMDPKEAIELFNSSRGHDIERQNYLEDLQYGAKRSNDGMEESEQEPKRGQAVNRPLYTPLESDSREERRHFNDSWQHRSFSPRGTNHRSYHRPVQDGLLPYPPLLPRPSFHPPAGASFHPYRWTPPPPPSPPSPPDSQWRRPSRSEETRSRYLPPEPQWSRPSHLQEDRRRSYHHYPYPPPTPPPSHLPHYSSRWTNESNGYSRREEEWAGPKMRHQHRYSHRPRVNPYDDYQSDRNWN
ncbi:RNA/RNP complex-1-interacting phosphatase-like [Thunnus albacares]|uniref:RNA/RNP complex-1-interacting phosphatase-like n=1 Tax=Thunnus albacares TaxID=8236 RepID=UPI001CF67058|nr:RNA/RNP complex-1-interacting phosphatase-like [Thunnus albacares]